MPASQTFFFFFFFLSPSGIRSADLLSAKPERRPLCYAAPLMQAKVTTKCYQMFTSILTERVTCENIISKYLSRPQRSSVTW